MKDLDITNAVDTILEDKALKKELGITKHDRMNFIRLRSIPKMLELLYRANKLQLKKWAYLTIDNLATAMKF